MSEYDGPGEGWREVPSTDLSGPHLADYTSSRPRFWVREETVPLLPTEEGTTIRITASTDADLVGTLVHLDLSDEDYPWHGNSDAHPAAVITGFEVLASPERWLRDRTIREEVRRETAKAVLDRVERDGWEASPEVWAEFGVEASS